MSLLSLHFSKKGVPIFGQMPELSCFPKRGLALPFRSIDKTVGLCGVGLRQQLRSRSSVTGREGKGQKMCLQFTTRRGRSLAEDLLDGPFTKEEFVCSVMVKNWVSAKRFGLVQKGKLRPIDDYTVYGQNSTSGHREETVDAGGIDCVLGVVKVWKDAHWRTPTGRVDLVLADGSHLTGWRHADFHSSANSLVGKLLDLERAFRQIAVAPDQRNIAITAVLEPVNRAGRVLRVSCHAASEPETVSTVLNGFARCLQLIGVRVIRSYAHPLLRRFHFVGTKWAHQHAPRNAFGRLLKLLGWAFKEGGDKDKPFADEVQLPGFTVELSGPCDGGSHHCHSQLRQARES